MATNSTEKVYNNVPGYSCSSLVFNGDLHLEQNLREALEIEREDRSASARRNSDASQKINRFGLAQS
jgi:hypothetical protein